MSGPAALPEFIEARRKSMLDEELYLVVNGQAMREHARQERLEAIRVKCAPLNKRILHSRLSWRKNREKAKRAKVARRRNRG